MIVVDGSRNGHTDEPGVGRTVTSAVRTKQIAPTMLQYLGLEERALQSVRLEGTTALPRPGTDS
ncbi:MAG TPA: hypothetical protein VGQ62_01895 [Chloroflexota bacterium]|nr:hypothetical protein [Chloroflexota bacterium]